MKQIIQHRGRILKIFPDKIEVLIIQESACAGCHAKGACTAADRSEKIIDIYPPGDHFEVGQEVILEGAQSMAWKAVHWAFTLPFALLFITLISLYYFTQQEWIAAIGSLVILIPYYGWLYTQREKMKSSFRFTIKQ